MSHFISSVSHFILSGLGLHGPWSVAFGLIAWAVAYTFLTRVITPDSIGDLMTLIAAVLPPFSFLFAALVAIVSFTSTPQHVFQGILFILIAAPALVVTICQCKNSEIRKQLKKTATNPHPILSTIPKICWGLVGAILVFASIFCLVFGGWQFLQGSRIAGTAWAAGGALIVAVSLIPGDIQAKNPIRKGVLALQPDDQDRSAKIIHRLLAQPPANSVAKPEPPAWPSLWQLARDWVTKVRR